VVIHFVTTCPTCMAPIMTRCIMWGLQVIACAKLMLNSEPEPEPVTSLAYTRATSRASLFVVCIDEDGYSQYGVVYQYFLVKLASGSICRLALVHTYHANSTAVDIGRGYVRVEKADIRIMDVRDILGKVMMHPIRRRVDQDTSTNRHADPRFARIDMVLPDVGLVMHTWRKRFPRV
jgi:hypothetical protein